MDTSEVDRQLEALHQQKMSLEKQVADLQQTVKSTGSERDQASQQYQQYVQQLNGQLQSLASKVLTQLLVNMSLSLLSSYKRLPCMLFFSSIYTHICLVSLSTCLPKYASE
jgi:predicted  nucleic acid-binding Zn-ribbon protein